MNEVTFILDDNKWKEGNEVNKKEKNIFIKRCSVFVEIAHGGAPHNTWNIIPQ